MRKQHIEIKETDEERKCSNYNYCEHTTKNHLYFYWQPFNQITCGSCMQEAQDAMDEVDHW